MSQLLNYNAPYYSVIYLNNTTSPVLAGGGGTNSVFLTPFFSNTHYSQIVGELRLANTSGAPVVVRMSLIDQGYFRDNHIVGQCEISIPTGNDIDDYNWFCIAAQKLLLQPITTFAPEMLPGALTIDTPDGSGVNGRVSIRDGVKRSAVGYSIMPTNFWILIQNMDAANSITLTRSVFYGFN